MYESPLTAILPKFTEVSPQAAAYVGVYIDALVCNDWKKVAFLTSYKHVPNRHALAGILAFTVEYDSIHHHVKKYRHFIYICILVLCKCYALYEMHLELYKKIGKITWMIKKYSDGYLETITESDFANPKEHIKMINLLVEMKTVINLFTHLNISSSASLHPEEKALYKALLYKKPLEQIENLVVAIMKKHNAWRITFWYILQSIEPEQYSSYMSCIHLMYAKLQPKECRDVMIKEEIKELTLDYHRKHKCSKECVILLDFAHVMNFYKHYI